MKLLLLLSLSLAAVNVNRAFSQISQISGGNEVPEGQYEAVGWLGYCTATLPGPKTVLTAAHCVCNGQSSPAACRTTASFTLKNVRPVDNPATTVSRVGCLKFLPEMECCA